MFCKSEIFSLILQYSALKYKKTTVSQTWISDTVVLFLIIMTDFHGGKLLNLPNN